MLDESIMSQFPPSVPHLPPANRSGSGCARALFVLIAGVVLVAVLAWLTKDKSGKDPQKVGNAPVPGQVK